MIRIAIGLAIAAAGLVGLVALQPSMFRVTRSARIASPPDVVFAKVNDFHQWETWSPWAKLDPNVRNRYEGPAAGTGAVLAWTGNKKVGEGRMTIIESRPGQLVKIRLEFVKPFAATNTAEFVFVPDGPGHTQVTWSMEGTKPFMVRAVGLVMNMDAMVGGQFEQGLANLRSVTEASRTSA